MKKTNAEITKEARGILKNNFFVFKGFWTLFVLIVLMSIVAILLLKLLFDIGGVFFLLHSIIQFALGSAFTLGLAAFALSAIREENEFNKIFYGFKRLTTAIGAQIAMVFFVWLWSLLLVIPGIIAAIRYSQTLYIIADNKSVGALEAINMSKEMMKGNKLDLFCLFLRMILWMLLIPLTFGIAVIYVAPYMQICFANFYQNLINAGNTEPDSGFDANATVKMAPNET